MRKAVRPPMITKKGVRPASVGAAGPMKMRAPMAMPMPPRPTGMKKGGAAKKMKKGGAAC